MARAAEAACSEASVAPRQRKAWHASPFVQIYAVTTTSSGARPIIESEQVLI